MAEHAHLRALANQLRGFDQMSKQFAERGVQLREVSQANAPSPSPKVGDQSASGANERYRHIKEKETAELVKSSPGGGPQGGQAARTAAQEKTPAELAKGFREAGVEKQAGNEIEKPTQTPPKQKQQQRGRGME